jgi:alpha/beta superfamily hydrolase
LSSADSRRVDQEAGIVEEAEFFGSGADRLFGMRYLPASGSPMAGVVMCGPILAQFRAHYRNGTLLARALATRGVAVQRFHYRGMGNSDGEVANLDLSTMQEDAAAAGARLTEQIGSIPIAYLGVNVGAYPAAVASRPGHMLILDSPPPNGRHYFRNAVRAHAVYAMQRESKENLTTEALLDQLRGGSRDVALLGCRLSLGLYETVVAASLVEEVGDSARPILMIGLGEAESLRPEGERMRSELAEKGFPVEVAVRDKIDPFWYVENSAPEDQPEIPATAERITDWVQRQISAVPAGRPGDNA